MGEKYNFKHGLSATPEYIIWQALRQRCANPKHPSFRWYGAKGVRVAAVWDDFLVFLLDVGKRPSDQHEIDRIDASKDYEPGNCRWLTKLEQRRRVARNRQITFDGKTLYISDWAKIIGVSPNCLTSRLLRGWPLTKMMTLKSQRVRRK